MEPTEQLKDEHEAIKLMLRVLGEMCKRLKAGKSVDPRHLAEIVEFIRIFSDKCHHGKEEGALFPAAEEAGIPKEGGPIGVMLAEHDAGRGYVKGLNDAVVKYKSGDQKAAGKIVENAQSYIALLEPHIEKENNILYPMIEMHISEKNKKDLIEQFEKIEEKIGAGKHEELHETLLRLKKIYVK